MNDTVTISRKSAVRLLDILVGSRCSYDSDHPLVVEVKGAIYEVQQVKPQYCGSSHCSCIECGWKTK